MFYKEDQILDQSTSKDKNPGNYLNSLSASQKKSLSLKAKEFQGLTPALPEEEIVFLNSSSEVTTTQLSSSQNIANAIPPDFFLLNLQLFKTQPCQVSGQHDLKLCMYSHNPKDKRRPTNTYFYAQETCNDMDTKGICKKGDNCQFAHNKVEELYHPEKYKKKFCSHYPNNIQKCAYGILCSFAHSDADIQIELLHTQPKNQYFYLFKYKTIFCPYGTNHDRKQCVYAHNMQDYRRNLKYFDYGPEACSMWNTSDTIANYQEGGCPELISCKKCHGWKEQEYHILNYKTKKCTNSFKCDRNECAFYHDDQDKRDITKLLPLDNQQIESFNENYPQKEQKKKTIKISEEFKKSALSSITKNQENIASSVINLTSIFINLSKNKQTENVLNGQILNKQPKIQSLKGSDTSEDEDQFKKLKQFEPTIPHSPHSVSQQSSLSGASSLHNTKEYNVKLKSTDDIQDIQSMKKIQNDNIQSSNPINKIILARAINKDHEFRRLSHTTSSSNEQSNQQQQGIYVHPQKIFSKNLYKEILQILVQQYSITEDKLKVMNDEDVDQLEQLDITQKELLKMKIHDMKMDEDDEQYFQKKLFEDRLDTKYTNF